VEQVYAAIGNSTYAVHKEPAREACFGAEPAGLQPQVRRCFPDRLYSHQAEAIEAAFKGHDVVQTTGTGSGKSVGLWAPVLSSLSSDSTATTIAVFPRVALANDQVDLLASWSAQHVSEKAFFSLVLGDGLEPIEIGVMNYQTREHHSQILKKARLIITTPDQLHSKILPYIKKSDRLITGLRFVILDEIHTYTGSEGSTMAALLQRLQIDCLHTAGNLGEFSRRLTGRSNIISISRDGSPKPEFTTFVVEANHREFIPSFHAALAKGFNGAPPTGLTFVQSKEGVRLLAEASRTAIENSGYPSTAQTVIA
jgi:DEAD/DEAH box helicase domain-containing protein